MLQKRINNVHHAYLHILLFYLLTIVNWFISNQVSFGFHENSRAESRITVKIRRSRITVFTQISAAALIKFFALEMRRLFESGAYLKIGRDKEIFSFF